MKIVSLDSAELPLYAVCHPCLPAGSLNEVKDLQLTMSKKELHC